MDIEQEEMQFLGVLGIYKEAYKIILTWRKIFSRITLTLILPLSFLFFAHLELSNLLRSEIIQDHYQLDHTRTGTSKYNNLSHLISSDWIYFGLLQIAYITFFFVLSLLSTAAVVYTIACIYTGKEITYGKVMSVVPKVWKRLVVTFLCKFVAFFGYHLILLILIVTWMVIFAKTIIGTPIIVIIMIIYLVGALYLNIIWFLAGVISVLEESCGFSAMIRSHGLIKGKIWVSTAVILMLNITLYIIRKIFEMVVLHGWSLGMAARVSYAFICFLLLFKFMLLELVIQTVIYFVCKSYHHENIDKSALSSHLEVFLLGEYVPLKSKDVQLEKYFDDV